MKKLVYVLSLCTLALLFLQCQREVGFFGNPDVPSESSSPDPIQAALHGNIFDENGLPAVGVLVRVGSQTVTTDANGYFRINNAPLDQKTSLVSASKPGYFTAYRVFGATSGANQVIIKLIKKTLAGTISASAGGEVSLSNGSKVALPANAVVIASNNNVYSGTINVYAAYIDPMAADIDQTVPGSFMAENKDGKRVTLVSYGMMAVELESASGEKLQIKSGSTATLTTAIPSSQQASAPASLPLWYVNEQTGLWKEEGTATRSGNVYVGEVSHFSFWNCDVGLPTIRLKLQFKNDKGLPLVHALVRLSRNTQGARSVTHGRTDSLGKVSGLVPYNESLVLEVLDRCGQPFYSQNIGPFTSNTTLAPITVTNTATAVLTVKGKLLNCSSAVVTNGFAIIKYGYYTQYAAANAAGEFETTISWCAGSGSSLSIIGVDNSTQQQGTSTTVAVQLPITDAGNIAACGTSSTQFFNYTLDGATTNLASPADSLMGYTFTQGSTAGFTTLMGFRVGANAQINLSLSQPSLTSGTYPVSRITVNNFDSTSIVPPFNVTFTTFPANVGAFYEGNFTGQFKDQGNVTHNVSGNFRIRRTQ